MLLAVLTIPAASEAVFGRLLDLVDPLPHMVWNCLFVILPMPTIAVFQSYFQGMILNSRARGASPSRWASFWRWSRSF